MSEPVKHVRKYILAFDTANEVVAIGLGRMNSESVLHATSALEYGQVVGAGAFSCDVVAVLKDATLDVVTTHEVPAHRASNTLLLSEVDAVLADTGVDKSDIAAIVCGRGPGSFTGVRICIATAKGAASALEVPLFGVSTLDAVAWNAWAEGVRGRVLVAADAMRKETYPALFDLDDGGVLRLTCDAVVKAAVVNEWLNDALAALEETKGPRVVTHGTHATNGLSGFEVSENSASATGGAENSAETTRDIANGAGVELLPSIIIGDALVKYADVFANLGSLGSQNLWSVTGRGLLLASRAGDGNPATLLPVYTRLSDAEESERARLSETHPKNLRTGVQYESKGIESLDYRPLDAAHAGDVARLESDVMGSDAWNTSLVVDELPRKDRMWWAAYDGSRLVGYCGGWVVDGQVQILKVATDSNYRRRGVARELISLVAADARNLGATEMTLEVRRSNEGAQVFYEKLGLLSVGVRPRYYSDREDAVVMTGPLPVMQRDAAGMRLRVADVRSYPLSDIDSIPDGATDEDCVLCAKGTRAAPSSETPSQPSQRSRPLILAIETSCDETAASVIDGEGAILSDVVASQVDFHARFGGVVPEIASRKHIEAICGVCDECLGVAGRSLPSRGVGLLSPALHAGCAEPAIGREAPLKEPEGLKEPEESEEPGAQQTLRLRWRDLDAVAVTYAPGLVGALVVGVAFAKGAAWGANKPLIAVNHLEGHLYANRIARPDIAPPLVASLVSGGHTLLVHVRDWGDYVTLGSTIDDAVGEAFDKVAKALGLGYPGGPVISKLAAQGNPEAIDFPRALMHSGDLQFSLSGLKTAVITYIRKERAAGREPHMPDVAASFTAAVVDVQVAKAKAALLDTGAKEFCLGGGVAANPDLRAAYERMCEKIGVRLTMPPLSACGDQAAMIAEVARERYDKGKFADLSLDVQAHAPLDDAY